MGAVFEITIISKKFIPLETCIEYLQQFGWPFSAEKLQSIRDWTWSGAQNLPIDQWENIESRLDSGEIILLYGTLGNKTAGIFVERHKDLAYETQLWFDDAVYPLVGISEPAGTDAFFEKLEERLEGALTMFVPYSITLAVMGEEIFFEYSPDLGQAKKQCRVDRWIQF